MRLLSLPKTLVSWITPSPEKNRRPVRNRRRGPLTLERLEDRLAPAIRTWTGGGANDLWSNAANWNTGVPVDGDDVRIAETAASAEVLFDVSVAGTGVTLNSLTSDGTNPTTEPFRITADTLTLTGAGPFLFGADLTVGGGIITGTASFTTSGTFALNGGTVTTTGSGQVNVNGGLSMTTSGKILGRTLNLNSNAIWTAGTLSLTNNAVFNVSAGATMNVTGDVFLDDATAGGTEAVNVMGTWRKSVATGLHTFEPRFNVDGTGANEGLVDVQTGILRLSFQNLGTFAGGTFTEATIQGAGTIDFNASASDIYNFDAATSFTIANAEFSSATANIAGSSITATTTTIDGGTVNFNAATTLNALNLTAGTISGSAVVNVGGAMVWNGGIITDSNAGVNIDFNVNGGLAMGVTTKTLDGRTLNLNSNATWTAGVLSLLNQAVLNVMAGRTMTVQGDLFLDDATNATVETVNVFGIWRRSAGTGNHTIETRFNVDGTGANEGVVDVQTGTLVLSFQNAGTFAGGTFTEATLQGAGRIDFQPSTTDVYNFDAASSFNVGEAEFSSGTANIAGSTFAATTTTVNGGTVNFNAATTLNALNLSAGTLSGSAVVTVGGAMVWNGGTITDSNAGVNVDFNVNGGLTMGVTTKTFDGRTLNLNSNATWTAGVLSLLNQAVLNVMAGRTMTVQGDQFLDDATTNSTETVNVFGTWRKSTGAGTHTIETRFNVDGTGANEGLVDVQTGTLSLSFQNAGTFAGGTFTEATIQGAGTFNLSGSATDVYNLNAGAALTGTGTVQLTNGILRLNAAATIGTATFRQSGGRVEGDFSLTINGLFDWQGGTQFSTPGAAQTIVNGGALFSVTNKALDGRTLNLNSNATWTAGLISLLNNAVINNNAGSRLEIQGDHFLDDGTGTLGVGEQFNNFGTLIKTLGQSTATIEPQLTNSGVIEVRDGTLSITGTFTNYNEATRTLSGGQYRVIGGPGALFPARLRWNNARIGTNDATILLDGPNAEITDQANVSALTDLARNTANGNFTLDHGANLLVGGVGHVISSFDGTDLEPNGQLVSIAFDPVSGNLFIYGDFDGNIAEFTPTGAFVDFIPVPAGISGNDIDLDFAPEALTIGGTSVPANSLLIISGDNNTLRAVNKNTGAQIAQVTLGSTGTEVGGAYHAGRDTLFVVEFNTNIIRELNPDTGAVLNSFPVAPAGSPAFTMNFGDVEVNQTTGNLIVVSSNQNRVRELTPTGAFVADVDVGPLGITAMSGVALNDAAGESYIVTTNVTNNTFRLNGFASVLGSFDASREPTSSLVSIAFDPATGNPFVYGSNNTRFVEFTPAGAIASSIPVPAGAISPDIDLDFAPEAFTLNGTPVPAGSLLIVDGISNTFRAVNKTTGVQIAQVTLGSAGIEVGGAYHAGRDTLFVIEFTTEIIRELNANTGAVINSFPVNPAGLPPFTVDFGDLEVNQTTGNLFIVSNTQGFIREMTPTGTFVRDLDISGLAITGMSGIAIDDATGQLWLSTTSAGPNVFRLSESLFENAGQMAIRNSTFTVAGGSGYKQTGGATTLDNGGLAAEAVLIQAGVLTGNGFIVADVTLSGTAQLTPGLSPGQIQILKDPYLGPTAYVQQSDSPFNPADFGGAGEYFHLENFEDGLFNTPGVTASSAQPLQVFAPPTATRDSVDADDGTVDGTGQTGGGGRSFGFAPGGGSITFTFNATVLGSLPTHAGIVWTDGLGPTVFEAFDAQGRSLGAFGPSRRLTTATQGATDEDRFFGVRFAGGISAIRIEDRASGVGLEIDHLQYGFDTAPVAGTAGGDLNLGAATAVNVEISNVPAPIGPDANRRVLGPTPYLRASDSPFSAITFASYFHLENFEDGLLNTPGVTPNVGPTVLAPGASTDSVDADDGTVDGFGTAGRSFFFSSGSLGNTFTFNAAALGGLPTHVGIVWTDGGIGAVIGFDAYDQNGLLIGGLVGNHADALSGGQTAEDRFYGAVNPGGISSIRIRHTSGGIEVDHLQYGRTTLTPSAPTRTFDQVDVKGDANFAGVINVSLLAGFVPTVGSTFAIVPDSMTRSGTFTTVNGSQINTAGLFFDTEYRANGADLIVAELDAGANITRDEPHLFMLASTFGDPGTDDIFTATINWGDGSPVEAGTVNQVANTVSGSHLYGDNGVFTVTVTITAPDGTRAVDSLVVTINNVDPTVEAGGPYFCPQEGTVQLSGSATDPAGVLDPLTFLWDLDNDGIFGETGAGATRGNETGTSPTFSSAGLAAGTMFTVTLRVTDGDGGVGMDTATIIIPDTLHVNLFTPTTTGFIARFNRPVEPTVLNLYDSVAASLGATDVVLSGPSGDVRGSLILNATNTSVTFVGTGGQLPAGAYNVTLRSGANAFRSPGGGQLDGNVNGVTGDDYTNTFNVAAPSSRVVSLPDFARGPGQAIDVPATADNDLPLTLNDGSGVTLISLELRHDPALLNITGFVPGPGIPVGAVTLDTSTPGVARLTINFALSSGPVQLVRLLAQVPDTAAYGAKHVLDLANIQINGSPVAGVDDDGVHVVGYFGDVSRNAAYSSMDALLTLRVAVGLDSGYSAFQLADPVIVADITGNGLVNATDSTRILQEAVGFDRLEIPALPGVIPPVPPGGPDPFLNLPTDLVAAPGSTITVPVNLDLSDGLQTVDIALAFDAQRLEVVSVDGVRRGTLTGDFDLFASHVDSQAGLIQIALGRLAGPISDRGSGSVVEITFRIRQEAPAGSVVLNLRQSIGTTWTQLNEGGLDLIPDPSDEEGDILDGRILILGEEETDASPVDQLVVALLQKIDSAVVATNASDDSYFRVLGRRGLGLKELALVVQANKVNAAAIDVIVAPAKKNGQLWQSLEDAFRDLDGF